RRTVTGVQTWCSSDLMQANQSHPSAQPHLSAFNIDASVTSLPGAAVRWDEIDWPAFGVSGAGEGPVFLRNDRNVAGYTGAAPPEDRKSVVSGERGDNE